MFQRKRHTQGGVRQAVALGARGGGRTRHGRMSTRTGSWRKSKKFGGKIDVSRFVSKAVIIEEEKAYLPTHRFEDFVIDEKLKTNIARKGYVIPTAIQDQAIPQILKGHDVIGVANTGEGKTAAFLVPLLNKLLAHPKEKILVIVPTRELAIQIDDECMAFSRGLGLYSVLLVGGMGMRPQIERLERNTRIVIGTPGRIKDMIEQKHLDLSHFHNLVLDEADRMLDMGFIVDIRSIISFLPEKRHTLFFSATFSREIEELAKTMLYSPVKISVKKSDTSKNVEQDVVHIKDKEEKYKVLCDILRRDECSKVLLFGRTKHGVEKLGKILTRDGFAAASIHGNKTQPQRQRALKDFRDERVRILVATDVAARGLDIPNVSHVINYDEPATYDDYVHRIGRTGRAGKRGIALTFVESAHA